MFNDKSILITGGTGSFGRQFVRTVLERYSPRRLIVFSRDELKQFEMEQVFNADCMRYFIGDVRDRDRLAMAMRDLHPTAVAPAMGSRDVSTRCFPCRMECIRNGHQPHTLPACLT